MKDLVLDFLVGLTVPVFSALVGAFLYYLTPLGLGDSVFFGVISPLLVILITTAGSAVGDL